MLMPYELGIKAFIDTWGYRSIFDN